MPLLNILLMNTLKLYNMEFKKIGRGGNRAGAGRPRVQLKKISTSFTLSPEMLDRIERIVQERGISRSQILAEALEKYLQ